MKWYSSGWSLLCEDQSGQFVVLCDWSEGPFNNTSGSGAGAYWPNGANLAQHVDPRTVSHAHQDHWNAGVVHDVAITYGKPVLMPASMKSALIDYYQNTLGFAPTIPAAHMRGSRLVEEAADGPPAALRAPM